MECLVFTHWHLAGLVLVSKGGKASGPHTPGQEGESSAHTKASLVLFRQHHAGRGERCS